MISNPSDHSHVQPYACNDSIVVGNSSHLSSFDIGKTHSDTVTGSLHLNEVLCVPAIRKNLLSMQRFSKDNHCYFEMDANGFLVKDNKTGKVLLTGMLDFHKLFFAFCLINTSYPFMVALILIKHVTYVPWENLVNSHFLLANHMLNNILIYCILICGGQPPCPLIFDIDIICQLSTIALIFFNGFIIQPRVDAEDSGMLTFINKITQVQYI